MDITAKKVNEEYTYIKGYLNGESLSNELININLYTAYVKNTVSGNEFIENVKKKLNITRKQDNSNKDIFQEIRFMDQMGLTHIMPGMWKELDYKNHNNISDELKNNVYYNFSQYINQEYSTIGLDGPSACGKSTIINYFKNKDNISNYIDNLSATYNFKPSSALSYVMLNHRLLTESKNMVIDRSPIANIGYQLCYYIMDRMSNESSFRYTLTSLCKEYIDIHNLTPYLEFLNATNLNVIIILDSDFEKIAFRLFNRGMKYNNSSDMMRSTIDCYLKAQNAAFAYLANELDYYTLDINFYRLKYSSNECDAAATESKIFEAITYHIRHIITETMKHDHANNPSDKFPKIMHLNTFAGTAERIINTACMLVHSNR